MIPIPILRKIRRCQRKGGKMKSHPSSTLTHISFKSRPLCRVIRACIQKHYHLVSRQKRIIHIAPLIRGVIRKMISPAHQRKPPVGLMHKADMRLIVPRRIKSDHGKLFLRLGSQPRPAQPYQTRYLTHDDYFSPAAGTTPSRKASTTHPRQQAPRFPICKNEVFWKDISSRRPV